MEQDSYLSNDENVDLDDLEHRLYAEIHYQLDNGDDVTIAEGNRCQVDEQQLVNERPSSVSKQISNRKESQRYWSQGKEQGYKPFYKPSQSGRYNSLKANADPKTPKEPIIPTGNRPKPFTPYTSLMSDTTSIASTSNSAETVPKIAQSLKVTSKLIKNKRKRKNPFSKQGSSIFENTYESFNQGLEENSAKKLKNPFSRTLTPQTSTRKETETNKTKKQIRPTENIDLRSDDDDDDDVVLIPSKPPPMILIDSSDDESPQKSKNKHKFTEPRLITQAGNKRSASSRCVSPTNSTISSDDFIVQADRRRIELDSFDAVGHDEIYGISRTVDQVVRNRIMNPQPSTSKNVNDVIFVAPSKARRIKQSNKSYEVGENSFAAIDVYESESSDFTDTVYAKGNQSKQKKILSCSSDGSDIESSNVVKTKRLRKRKSSGSNKGSDYVNSDEYTSDDNDGVDAFEGNASVAIPYLVRGEAVGKLKQSENRSSKGSAKRKLRTMSEKQSDEEFISTLSSIVHAGNDDEDDLEQSQDVATETIAARDIVESVLEQRSKRSKRMNSETVEVDQQNDEVLDSDWIIKDQVGFTDGNLGESDQPSMDNVDQIIENVDESTSVVAVEESPMETDNQNQNNKQTDTVNDISGRRVEYTPFVHKEIGWNEEMVLFYNKSWGGETFDVQCIQSTMPKRFQEWEIVHSDKNPTVRHDFRRGYRTRAVRCLNCREKGHRSPDCPLPPVTKRCFMCGQAGHSEPRCQNTICYLCGARTNTFTRGCDKCDKFQRLDCFVCRNKGHRARECPDKWRRYYLTTQANVPLVEPDRPLPNKAKYCCVCASRGHIAENCRSADRLCGHVKSTMFIKNFQSSYELDKKPGRPSFNQDKFVILNSASGNFKFNYDEDVNEYANNFYTRFRLKVKLDSRARRKARKAAKQQLEELLDINEPHVGDEKRIKIIDLSSNLENTMSSKAEDEITENAAEEPNEENVMIDQAKDLKIELSLNETNEMDYDDVSSDDEDVYKLQKLAELTKLEEDQKRLQRIKEEIMMKRKLAKNGKNFEAETEQVPATLDSDSNYSFSEFFKESQEPKGDPTKPLDYIPLVGNTVAKRSDMVLEVNEAVQEETENTAKNEMKCEAKIFLTAENSRYLVTSQGNSFLQDKSKEYDVLVRMEWRTIGNVLVVLGLPKQQDEFHTDLCSFFQKIEMTIKKRNDVGIPKNRVSLIKYLRETIGQLEKPMGNVKDLYERMRRYKRFNTKASRKHAERLRKELNMILMGKCGFREGNKHLIGLQEMLRSLAQSNDQIIPIPFRRELVEHLNYIFSSNEHENYEDLVQQYIDLKRMRSLPILSLDRSLLGLKINVKLDNSSSQLAPEEDAVATPNNSVAGMESSVTKLPALMDIKINIVPENSSLVGDEDKQWRPKNEMTSNKVESLQPQPKNDTKEKDSSSNVNKTSTEPKNVEKKLTNPLEEPSSHWSQKCLEFLEPLLDQSSIKSNAKALAKVHTFIKKSEKNKLTQHHYILLSQIFGRIKSENS